MHKYLGILIIFLALCQMNSLAQLAPGKWQTFASHKKAQKVIDAGDKMFFITNGGMFSYNLEDHSLKEFNKINGLANNQIKTAEWVPDLEALVVAYENSDIDILYENDIINLSDIKRKSISGDKTINNIHVLGNNAYLACSFGIVVVNLLKHEIKDTYIIGSEGTYLNINDITNTNDRLYAATNVGMYYIGLDDPNPLDYSHWTKDENTDQPNGKYMILNYSEKWDRLFAGVKDDFNQTLLVYKDGNERWRRGYASIYHVFDIDIDDDIVTLSGWTKIQQYDINQNLLITIGNYATDCVQMLDGFPFYVNGAQYNEEGLWIADDNYGAIHIKGNQCECVQIESPDNNDVHSISLSGSDVYIARGGHTTAWVNSWNPFQIKKYSNNDWSTISKYDFSDLDTLGDVLNIAIDPKNPGHYFAGCWEGGLAEFQDDKLVKIYDSNNSSLESTFDGGNFVRIGGVEFDRNGNLWVSNSEVSHHLSVLKTDGEWESFNLSNVDNDRRVGDLIVTENDHVWVILTNANGIYVMSTDGENKKKLNVTSYFTNGSDVLFTDMNDVLSIAEDLDGAVWVGTTRGVTYYNSPEQIFSQDNFYAYQPGLDIGDGVYHPLLEDEVVTTIAVDGANRKWFGTRSSGLYLISEDGESEILHFDMDNSPLFSNNISDIEIDHETGTVYIGTEKGLLAYRSEAISAKNTFENLYVYPNPVRETYSGNVYISGLEYETNVKITTVSGRLVYETTSLGGQAVWDGKDLAGNRVHTGVYLVFCANHDGSESAMTKLLFIR